MFLRKKAMFGLLAFSVAFAGGLPSLKFDFAADDSILITENPSIQSPKHLLDLFKQDFFHRPLSDVPVETNIGYYRPLTKLTFLLDWSLWGRNPLGFHLTQVVLHALVVLLLFGVFLHFVKDEGYAFFGACFFALWPAHVQAVGFINARSDLLSTLGLLLACHGVLKDHSLLRLIGLGVGMLSKEVGVFFPTILLATSYVQRHTQARLLRILWETCGVVAIYFLLRHSALGDQVHASLDFSDLPFRVKHLLIYLRSIIGAYAFSAEALQFDPTKIITPEFVGLLSGAIVYGLAVIFYLKKRSPVLILLLIFGVSLIPFVVGANIPKIPGVVFFQERWTYLPSVAWSALFVAVMLRLERNFKYICIGFIVGLGFTYVQRLKAYHNDETFYLYSMRPFEHFECAPGDTDVCPEVLEYQSMLFIRGKDFSQAERLLRKAIALKGSSRLYFNLASVRFEQGDYDGALEWAKRALFPDVKKVGGGYAQYMLNDETSRLRPRKWAFISACYKKQGEMQKAHEAIDQAILGDPAFAPYYIDKARLYVSQKNKEGATMFFLQALKLDPCLTDATRSLVMLGRMFSEPTLGQRATELSSRCR